MEIQNTKLIEEDSSGVSLAIDERWDKNKGVGDTKILLHLGFLNCRIIPELNCSSALISNVASSCTKDLDNMPLRVPLSDLYMMRGPVLIGVDSLSRLL